jgi:hypothetical protein
MKIPDIFLLFNGSLITKSIFPHSREKKFHRPLHHEQQPPCSSTTAPNICKFLNFLPFSLYFLNMVESSCQKFIISVDESKLVKHLGGSGLAMPIEIVPFCWKFKVQRLQALFEDLVALRSSKLEVKTTKPL